MQYKVKGEGFVKCLWNSPRTTLFEMVEAEAKIKGRKGAETKILLCWGLWY